ncbi:hypothetical protein RV07_GL001409 [Enterococcus malodoratus]|nr:hypothetical protein RV07_GL001409 [Enterococcus malodoratus]
MWITSIALADEVRDQAGLFSILRTDGFYEPFGFLAIYGIRCLLF